MDSLAALRAGLAGDLVVPDCPQYEQARRAAFERHARVRPAAVVRCATVHDVVHTLRFARQTGLPVVPRGGGHCFAGRSSTTGLVLDLGRLRAVQVDRAGRATVGAGARLAQVYASLQAHGRTLPAGCGPTVGIAGLTLGGGIGLFGRRFGLTCDHLVAAEVVLPDGRVVRCDEQTEPDLFWALRGAGGGQFGVVTTLDFETVQVPMATRVELRWREQDAVQVITAWQAWAPEAHPDVTLDLSVVAGLGRPLEVRAFGAVLRDAADTARLLGGMLDHAPRTASTDVGDGWTARDLKHSFASAAERDGQVLTTRSRSELFSTAVPPAAVEALVHELRTNAPPHPARRELHLVALGGGYDAPDHDATAYAHRGQRFLLEHTGPDEDPWVDRSWTLAHPHGSGRVYANFPDPRLADGREAYHGSHLPRLVEVKSAYDPDRFFDFEQAV